MENESIVIVWLIFQQIQACCGKKRVVRRLIEFDTVNKKVVKFHNLERGRKVSEPPAGQLMGRRYCRLYELSRDIREPFLKECLDVGAIPNGVTIS